MKNPLDFFGIVFKYTNRLNWLMIDNRKFILEYKERKLQLSEQVFKKRFPDILREILDYNTTYNLEALSFQQMVYNWIYNIQNPPKCPITSDPVLFDRSLFKYKTYRGKGIRTSELQQTITKKRLAATDYREIYNSKKQIEPMAISFEALGELLNSEFMPIINFGGFSVKLLSRFPEIYNYIISDKFLSDSGSLQEKIYRVINNIREIPTCATDGVTICNFKGFTKGYSQYGKTTYRNAVKGKRLARLDNVSDIYNIEDTTLKLQELIALIKSEGKSTQNLYQSLLSKDVRLVKSVLDHTKQYANIKFSNRVFLLLSGEPKKEKDYHRPVFYSLDRGYDMRFSSMSGTSKPEQEMFDWLIEYVPDLTKTRGPLDGLEMDMYSDKFKIGIELDGVYWHNYEIVGDSKMFHKHKLAESKHIRLLNIFETEWIQKKDIVKSLILSKFNIFETRLYARKCKIVDLDSKTCSQFLEENHLQGKDNSKYKFGLLYDSELVSVMTFGNRRISKNNTMELIRFCNKKNTTVIGGASKLLAFFIKKYDPELIKSYANSRLSDGNLYKQLSFTFKHQSPPNYWYYKPTSAKTIQLKHRSGYQKHRLVGILENFDPTKTEWQNMKDHGYMKIYDCGNLVFEYSKTK